MRICTRAVQPDRQCVDGKFSTATQVAAPASKIGVTTCDLDKV
jgi:hypothetical protein